MLVFTKKLLGLSQVIFFGTVSCQTPFHDGPVPALLLNGNVDDRAQIKIVLEKALNKDGVILSSNPFATKSFLIIEKSFKRSLEGNLTGGFIISSPEKFMLLKDGKGCLIKHVNTDQTWRLKNIVCIRADNES